MPRVIISDRDPRFTAHFWRTFTQLVGTRLNMSSSFHPETDGQTERVHKVLEEVLRHYVDDDQLNWDKVLPVAEYAINSAKHSSTGYSPFFLNYGRERVTRAAFLHGLSADLGPTSPSALAEQVVTTLHEALERAKQSIAKAKAHQAAHANKRRSDVSFQRGDEVLLSNDYLRRRGVAGVRKLDHLWSGPFKVTEKVGRVSYRLALPPEVRMHDVFHVSLLKPFKTSSSFPDRPIPPSQNFVPGPTDTPFYIVEKFVAVRPHPTRRNAKQYLVRWRDYSPSDDTWEPATSLRKDLGKTTLGDLVAQFEASQQRPQ